jgi:hypothetical protein
MFATIDGVSGQGMTNYFPGSLTVNTGRGDFLTTLSAVLPIRT